MPITYVYLYETRKLDFLDLLLIRLKDQGFVPIVLNETPLAESTEYAAFIANYQHFSDNPYNFELSCFARYFAIFETHKNIDAPFIIADSDIFVSQTLYNDLVYNREFFYGSAGFDSKGEECQISPHFSIWNYELLSKFVNYICEFYIAHKNTSYIKEYYEERKKRLGRTGISDMTLLYDWVKKENIAFVDTNNVDSSVLIDHNISSVFFEGGRFLEFLGRKKVIFKDDKILFEYRDKNNRKFKKEAGVIHFQGRYKKALTAFYQKRYAYFRMYSAIIWAGRNARSILAKFGKS